MKNTNQTDVVRLVIGFGPEFRFNKPMGSEVRRLVRAGKFAVRDIKKVDPFAGVKPIKDVAAFFAGAPEMPEVTD